MPNEEIVAEPAESAAPEKSLAEHLADFDEHKESKESAGLKIRNDEQIAEFESRIGELETENGTLSERAEKSEQMADAVEAQALRNDKRDHAELVKRLASEIGITERVAKMEIRKWFEEDETHLTLADNRADNPDDFEAVIGSMMADLQDKHPQRENHRGIAHAYRIARNALPGGGSYGEDSYGDFPKMNDQEFAVASERVFADMKSGKLRPEVEKRGGFISTRGW